MKFMPMLTLNNILKEIKDVPLNRLEELYQLVHSLTPKTKQTEALRKKILSFGGAFDDMSAKDYADFIQQTRKARTQLFDRNIDL
jgi:D-alanyl-D-alanine dipeptidase